MTGHTVWTELASGHALDALEPEDEHAFLDHLRGCDACLGTLGDMRATAAQLALAAEPTAPPPGLRRAIAAETGGAGAPGLLGTDRGRGAPRGWLAAFRGRQAERWLQIAAAVVLVLALASWNLVLRTQQDTTRRALRRSHDVAAALAAPDATTVTLTGVSGAYGSVVVRRGRAWLVVDGLPKSDRRRVYVLWALRDAGGPRPVTLFEVVNLGVNVIDLKGLDVRLDDVRELSVTGEPRGVAPTIPSTELLAGTVDG